MTTAVDRGGPFAHQESTSRNWMRATAPGIGFRFAVDESSPIGGGLVLDARRKCGLRWRRMALALAVAALVIGGTMSLGHGVYLYGKAQLAQVLLHSAWNKTRTTGEPARPWPWADTHPVARLIMPARNADVLVLAGASGRTLAFGPGHLDGSSIPGEPGNAVITAHRDTHFRFLQHAAIGDDVVIERANGTRRHFRITSSYVADHRALNLPRDTPRPTLTLVTCFPFDALNPGGPLRYVVVAEAI
ncbi:MAG: class GN sortase [Betaproteobacteria bacterium]